MALSRVKKRVENVTYGDSVSDKPKTWTSYPNASVGKDVEKSIGQVLKDGGVKGVKNKTTNKYVGKEITSKKGNKTTIKDLIRIKKYK